MNDNLKLIAQTILLIAGPLLAKHGITADQSAAESITGGLATLLGIVWKFWHWHATPDTATKVPISRGPLLLLAVLSVGFGVTAGCGTAGGLFSATPQVQTIQQPNGTTSLVTNITYAESPVAASVIQTGQTVSQFLPPPYSTAATTGLGLIAGLLGIVAAVKSKKVKSLQSLADLAQPIIAGVEAASDKATKLAIQSHATAAGVQSNLDALVQTVTQTMPGKP